MRAMIGDNAVATGTIRRMEEAVQHLVEVREGGGGGREVWAYNSWRMEEAVQHLVEVSGECVQGEATHFQAMLAGESALGLARPYTPTHSHTFPHFHPAGVAGDPGSRRGAATSADG